MAEVSDTADDAIGALLSPTLDQVDRATTDFSSREIANAAAKRALSGGGGSGAAIGHGAAVFVSETITAWAGGTLPFDTINYDTDNYWDAGSHKMIVQIPTEGGVPGIYAINAQVEVGPDAAITGVEFALVFNGVLSPAKFPFIKKPGTDKWLGRVSITAEQDPSHEMYLLDENWTGVGTVDVLPGSFLSIAYLGEIDPAAVIN